MVLTTAQLTEAVADIREMLNSVYNEQEEMRQEMERIRRRGSPKYRPSGPKSRLKRV